MSWLFLGLGLALVFEGLVFALLPGRLENILATIATMSRDKRRIVGLVAIAFGVALVWVAQA
ncbi:MAG: DUF2065 domain-containing protein [Pseudomonadota bacterium]|nr:DUF2065 domain-containing protein [Pseudomonadota bacterium]